MQILNSTADRLRGDLGAVVYEEIVSLTDQLFIVRGNLLSFSRREHINCC